MDRYLFVDTYTLLNIIINFNRILIFPLVNIVERKVLVVLIIIRIILDHSLDDLLGRPVVFLFLVDLYQKGFIPFVGRIDRYSLANFLQSFIKPVLLKIN